MVVPTLSPSNTGTAPASPSRLCTPSGPACRATPCSTPMVAELLCTTSVIPSPSSRPQSGFSRTCAIQASNSGRRASGSTTLWICSIPAKSSPNENTAVPICRPRFVRATAQRKKPPNSTSPSISSTRNASSWTVTVVPMLAPKMTATAWGSSSSPALTNPMTMTVVAELLCTTAVTTIPASAPVSGVRVRAANARRSRSPAACCSASLIRSIPNRNSASPPNSGKIPVLSVILPPFWVLMPLYGPGT